MSHAVAQFKLALDSMNERTLVSIMIGAYVVLIAVLAGANTIPALPNPLVELNDVVRGLIGG